MSYKQKLKKIKTFVFDIDGVFTDGSILLSSDGNMCRTMNVLDGYGVMRALQESYLICCITGGCDPMVKKRLQHLGITGYYPNSKNKMNDFNHFIKKYNLQNDEILAMGDDIPDEPLLKNSGIGACPANAVPEIKKIADYISPAFGGKGCVRDVIEQVMKIQGKWIKDNETQSK